MLKYKLKEKRLNMNYIGENLKKIRLLKNLSLKEAGKLLGMSATAISKYEKGLIVPNSAKIIEFANAYQVKTLELLKVYSKPEMKFSAFRKKSRLQGQKLLLLQNIIQDEVAKYLEVLDLNNIHSSFSFKKYDCESLEEVEEAANQFRKYMQISLKQPLSDLINMLENLGIVIIFVHNSKGIFNDFDGLSEIVNGVPIIVLLEGMKDGARQRFTIAHELGHLLLQFKNKDLDEEKMCHRFASALLMPKEAVIREFGITRSNINFGELEAFKQEYKVSYAEINYRLKDLNIINDYLYKKLSILINKNIGKNDPNPIQAEISYQFRKLVYKLEASNIISVQKACEYLGVTLNEYNNKDNYYRY